MPLGTRCIVFAAIATSSVRGFSVSISVIRHAGGSVRLVSSLMDTDKTTAMIDSSRRRVYGCAFSPKRRNSDWQLWSRNRRQDTGPTDEPTSFSLMDSVFFTPTQGLFDSLKVLSIPLLALLLYAIFVDPLAAFTTMILFASLRTVAIRLVLFPQLPDTPRGMVEDEDEDERNDIIIEQLKVDAFCFGISASSVLIVGPDFSPFLVVASIVATVLLLATSVNDIVNEEQLNEDDKLLNQWDKRFRKQNNIDDTN